MAKSLSRRQLLQSSSAVAGATLAARYIGPAAASPSQARAALRNAAQAAGELGVAIFSEPGTLDFMQQADMAATIMDWNIYDQLARWNYDTGHLDSELATEWTQESDTTWLVTLRPGVQFHKDYGEMTAEDVAFSVNYVIENDARIKFLYSGVDNVEVVDPYTLRYNLSVPSTPFVMTAIQGFGGLVLSKKAYEEIGPDQFARTPVGTGPFLVEDWAAGDHLTLGGFTEYWDPDYPLVDTVTVRFVPDPTVKLSLLTTDQVQVVDSLPYEQLADLEGNAELVVQTTAGWNWDYISFGDATGVFADKRVRQAMSYAIDRQALVDAVYYGHAIPAQKPLPPGFQFEDSAITKYGPTADLETAKQLMSDAGIAGGFSVPAYAQSDVEPITRVALIVAEQLKEIGIELDVQFLDLASYTEKARSSVGDYLDLNRITIMSPDPDSAINWFWHTGGILTHNYSNPEVDALIDQGKVQTDPAERQKTYSDLQALMLDESWFIYTVHRELVRSTAPDVTGYQITPQDMDFRLRSVAMEYT